MLDIETQIGNLASKEVIDIAKEFHHNIVILDFFFVDKKLRSKYSEKINGIAQEVEKKIREDMED